MRAVVGSRDSKLITLIALLLLGLQLASGWLISGPLSALSPRTPGSEGVRGVSSDSGTGPMMSPGPRIRSSGLQLNAKKKKSQTLRSPAPKKVGVLRGEPLTTEEIETFSQWLGKRKFQLYSARIGQVDGLRGLIAGQPIKRGQSILSYARGSIMDLASLSECPCSELVKPSFWESAPWFVQLALWLLAERAKGGSSRFLPYINILPNFVATPIHWSAEELSLLQYPVIADGVTEQQALFDKIYTEVQANLSPSAEVSKLELTWALQIVLSRGLDSVPPKKKDNIFSKLIGDEGSSKFQPKALVPLLDLINHKTDVKQNFVFNPSEGVAEDDRYTVNADRDYIEGEQVFISYGAKSNDELLQLYGFVEPENPADTFALTGLSDFAKFLTDSAIADPSALDEGRISVTEEGVSFSETAVGALQKIVGDEDKMIKVLTAFLKRRLAELEAGQGGKTAEVAAAGLGAEEPSVIAYRFRAEKIRVLNRALSTLQ